MKDKLDKVGLLTCAAPSVSETYNWPCIRDRVDRSRRPETAIGPRLGRKWPPFGHRRLATRLRFQRIRGSTCRIAARRGINWTWKLKLI